MAETATARPDMPAFVNAAREFLAGTYEVPFSPIQAVIDVLEDVPGDPAVLAGSLSGAARTG
jgi:hypothetical protein